MAGNGNNIDNLNFALIIDDSDFDKKIKEDLRKAKEFNKQLSEILNVEKGLRSKTLISDASVKNAESFNRVIKEISEKMNALPSSVKVFNEETEKGEKNVNKTNRALSGTRDLMGDLTRLTGIAFGAAGIRSFVNSLVRVSGEFEVQKMALTSMLQDANKANVVFEQLRQNALNSPYTFQDLSKYAKQLTAFNIDADMLVDTEKRLADVAAGLGVDMGRIILAYGQVKSAGVLKGTELRQFTEAGVPLLQSLADQIERTEGKAISLSEVFDRISKKQIPFEMVEQAFRDMTNAGGKFYNMQEVLVETLQGKIGKLRDAWQQMLYAIGNQNGGILKGAVDVATNLVVNYEKFGWVVSALIKTFGVYASVLAVAAIGQKAIAGAEAIRSFMTLGKQIKAAATAMEAYSIASKAAMGVVGVVAALGFGVYELVKSLNKADEATKRVDEAALNYNKTANEEIAKLNLLRHTLETAKKGSDEWNDAKKEVVQNYGQYFTGLDNEISKVGNLETAYDNLVVAVKNSIAARTFADFYQGESSSFDSAKDNFLKQVQKITRETQPEITQIALNEVRKYIDSNDITKDVSGFFSVLYKYNLSALTGGSYKVLSEAQQEFRKNTKDLGERLGLSNGKAWNPDEYFATLMAGKKETVNPTWTPQPGKGKTQAQKDIESTIDSVKELQRAFKDLTKEGFSDADANKIIDAGFQYLDASVRNRRDFWEYLNELADQLDKFDHEAAERLRADVARGQAQEAADQKKQEIKDVKESAKALKEYQKVLRQWQNEDFNLGGTGFEFDVRKIASDYNTALGKIDEKYLNAVEKAKEAHAGNSDAIAEETARLGELADAERAYEQAKMQEKIGGLASSYMKDELKSRGINLKDISKMSLGQLSNVRQQLEDISNTFLEITNAADAETLMGYAFNFNDPYLNLEDFFNSLEENGDSISERSKQMLLLRNIAARLGITFEELKEKIKEQGNEEIKNIDEKTIDKLSRAAQGVEALAGAFAELATALGHNALANELSMIGNTVQSFATAVGKAASGDTIGAIVTVLATGVKNIAQAIKANEELRSAIRATAEEARKDAFSKSLSDGVDNVFGSSGIRKISNAAKNLSELRSALNADKEAGDNRWFRKPGGSVYFNTQGTRDFFSRRNISAMAGELGLDLLDQYGNLNSETLQKILNTYTDLTKKDKEWIQSAINNSEAYKEAMEQTRDVMDEVFGNIASDAASKIVEQWKNAGDAALDYTDILDDVATKYAEMIVQSMLLDKVFNKNMQDELWKQLQSGDVEGAMSTVAEGMDAVVALAPMIEQVLSPLKQYVNGSESSSDNTLKAGISKELVEGNSSLIASYMNAIRADVSVTRMDIHTYLPVIANDVHNLVGGPSLATYQAEVNAHLANIEAYNADIAQSNADLLRHIRSVITPSSSGGSAIRTTK